MSANISEHTRDGSTHKMTPTERARLDDFAEMLRICGPCVFNGRKITHAELREVLDRLAEAEKALTAIDALRDRDVNRRPVEALVEAGNIARAYFASHQPDGETHG